MPKNQYMGSWCVRKTYLARLMMQACDKWLEDRRGEEVPFTGRGLLQEEAVVPLLVVAQEDGVNGADGFFLTAGERTNNLITE